MELSLALVEVVEAEAVEVVVEAEAVAEAEVVAEVEVVVGVVEYQPHH